MSDTTGWKRKDEDYIKVIAGYRYVIWKQTTGFFPGEYMLAINGQLITPKHRGYRKLADAKRAAHRHAEGQ